MLAFEITLNGKRQYTIGNGEFGSIHFDLSHCRIMKNAGKIHEECWFYGSGAKGLAGVDLYWPQMNVHVGDEITIRVIEADTFDPGADEPILAIND